VQLKRKNKQAQATKSIPVGLNPNTIYRELIVEAQNGRDADPLCAVAIAGLREILLGESHIFRLMTLRGWQLFRERLKLMH